MITQGSVLLFIIFIIPLLWLWSNGFQRKRKLPPSPTKLPLIGNLHLLGQTPHKSLLDLSRKHGDLMLLQLGSVPTLIVSSPKAAKEIFTKHDLNFSGRPTLYAAHKVSHNSSNITFAPYGEYWRELRKIVVSAMFTLKRVEFFAGIRGEEVGLMMDEIRTHVSSSSTTTVDLTSMAIRLANAVICRAAFGRKNDLGFTRIMDEVQPLVAEFNFADYFPWLTWMNKINGVDGRINKIMKEIDTFFNQVIAEHRNKMETGSEHQDIVDVLLTTQSINLNDHQLAAVLMDLFFAGTDTASAIIEWTMAEMMRNPQAREKAQQQIREIGGKEGVIQEKDLSKLTYMKLVIKETLRLHPPAPLLVPRETIEDCTIGEGFEIPAKTRVIVNLTAFSMDSEYWEKPEIFWPERFADGGADYGGRKFEFLPFGAGRRGCPGMNFGMFLVELAVANLLFKYDWELPTGTTAENLDMEEKVGLTVHKKLPLCLVAKPV